MQEYQRVRADWGKDTVLLFKLGDFYEVFFDEAAEVAKILGIALTKRNEIPMCGIPYHCLDKWCRMLMAAGKGVAVSETTKGGGRVTRNWEHMV